MGSRKGGGHGFRCEGTGQGQQVGFSCAWVRRVRKGQLARGSQGPRSVTPGWELWRYQQRHIRWGGRTAGWAGWPNSPRRALGAPGHRSAAHWGAPRTAPASRVWGWDWRGRWLGPSPTATTPPPVPARAECPGPGLLGVTRPDGKGQGRMDRAGDSRRGLGHRGCCLRAPPEFWGVRAGGVSLRPEGDGSPGLGAGGRPGAPGAGAAPQR